MSKRIMTGRNIYLLTLLQRQQGGLARFWRKVWYIFLWLFCFGAFACALGFGKPDAGIKERLGFLAFALALSLFLLYKSGLLSRLFKRLQGK